MSAKGNKAKASKDPTPKSAPSVGRHPVRSPIDDGARSRLLGLSPNLSQRRRSGSPLLLGLSDPPPRKRKATTSLDNVYPTASAAEKSSSAEDVFTSASAAERSSSAEDTPSSASAADKPYPSSVEGTLIVPLGIRISNAMDEKLEQLNNKTPPKEHSAIEAEKNNENGNTPPSAAETAKTLGTARKTMRGTVGKPWGDLEDEGETNSSSEVPSLVGEPSLLPALNAESSHPLNHSLLSSNSPEKGTGIFPVSNRHDFKSPGSSPRRTGEIPGEDP